MSAAFFLRQRRGVTLIMVAAVLSVLAALATGFYSLTLMQTRSATRYSDSVTAELMARAGVADGLARVRESAFKKTEETTDCWFTVNYYQGAKKNISFADQSKNNRDDDGDGVIDNPEERNMAFSGALSSALGPNSGRYILNVTDAASKININAGDNLAPILDNLCRILGSPLTAANQDALQPRRWAVEGAAAGLYDNALNGDDKPTVENLYYRLYDKSGVLKWDGVTLLGVGRPKTAADGTALYGDGYAIAGHRARNGRFENIEDVKRALTYVERNGNDVPDDPLEQLEIEVKFAAIRDYITIDSWVDTTTVCVGKFEWVSDHKTSGTYDIAIDRNKSWVADDPVKDPDNRRGSLRDSYVSIMNGHGAGQFRRIKTNGVDWIQIEKGFEVPPGPISSYMIIGKPDATPDPYDYKNGLNPDQLAFAPLGALKDDPKIDYSRNPLCIHRAPVNINTASDKVLASLFMGLNVQHGHPMSVGTDADRQKLVPDVLKAPPQPLTATDWKVAEYADRKMEPYLLTLKGLKRVPADSGKIVFDRSIDDVKAKLPAPIYDIDYLNNNGLLDPYGNAKMMNEAQELAIRIISARQRRIDPGTGEPMVSDIDPLSADAVTGFKGYERGPFRSWDDFYFRVVKAWDDSQERLNDPKKISVARMIMANFNSNTDILKFNPNIEWIDRWGRNFTEMEPVMIFEPGENEPYWLDYLPWPATADSDGMWNAPLVSAKNRRGAYYSRSLRYKSEELIDKTDLNRSSTEFSFDSGGIFEIQSIGQVVRRGQTLAEKKFQVLTKVYDVWRESTQDQFVRGTISEAANGNPSTRTWNISSGDNPGNYSGKIVRDARNGVAGLKRLALDTLPESLTPLNYTLDNPSGIADVVDTGAAGGRDAWGNVKAKGMPDTVANRVMPAQYDGQIVLATNTAIYDTGSDSTTFLASYNGDLDTDTSAGNGREQSKSPTNKEVRVLDTIGLLGRLDDIEVDFDPKEPGPKGATYDVFAVKSANKVMRALDKNNYWENVTCRMGDLRPDGVFLGNVGISGKDATLKYLVKNNLPTTSTNEATICMWFKPNWHVTDGQEHEFYNACGVGDGYSARGSYLRKAGKFTGIIRYGVSGATNGAGGGSEGDLYIHTEDKDDADEMCALHGGRRSVPVTTRESASFRTQPFRWGMVGTAFRYKQTMTTWPWPTASHDDGNDDRGRWDDGGGIDARNSETAEKVVRPFIDTARDPEGASWSAQHMWTKTNRNPMSTSFIGASATITQEAAWKWADGATTGQWIFGCNNLNLATDKWLYRSVPIDGTQAVVDEYKVASKFWDTTRLAQEMTTSRYYLPQDPKDASQCPTFISQTLLQSLKGYDKTSSNEEVTLVRVSWNCFTPRFMHENKQIQKNRSRAEMIGDKGKASAATPREYRGPFDYIQYNWDILPRKTASDARLGEPELPGNELVTINAAGEAVPVLNAERPAPRHYFPKQAHSTSGCEVEVLRDPDMVPGSGDEVVLQQTFKDPNAFNNFGDATNPIRVKTSQLRYRVRFKYPVDPFVAQIYAQDPTVNPQEHYLLDTPVFDDISITYFGKPRILAFRDVNE